MKRSDKKFLTDHVEVHLVCDEMEESDFDAGKPVRLESFLLIGPPGGPLARLDGFDLELVVTIIQQAQRGPFYAPRNMIRPAPAPRGCGPDCR